VFVFTFVFSV